MTINDCMNYGRDNVYSPDHYTAGGMETIDKIAQVIDGLNGFDAYCLGNIIKYVDRAGKKGNANRDLAKANNYAHELLTGQWRDEAKRKLAPLDQAAVEYSNYLNALKDGE